MFLPSPIQISTFQMYAVFLPHSHKNYPQLKPHLGQFPSKKNVQIAYLGSSQPAIHQLGPVEA